MAGCGRERRALERYIFVLQRGATAENAELGKMAGDERYDLWRKQGFICKPYSGEISDGTRFISEYMEQAQKYSADDDWMEDDVLLGKDQGGDDPAAPAMPAVGAANHAVAVAARRTQPHPQRLRQGGE